MAVTQFFVLELPEGAQYADATRLLTLDRDDAEQIHRDLREALGYSGWGSVAPTYEVEPTPEEQAALSTGKQVSPEEALARVQAMEQVVPSYQRNPGSGIGNG